MADESEYVVQYEDKNEPVDWLEKPGKCKVTYPNGNTFEGTYDDEKKKQGVGTYTWSLKKEEEDEEDAGPEAPVAIYSGEFFNGKRHNIGTLTYPDGARYEGNFVKNKKDGQGRYFYTNGDIYEGEWSADLKHGQGTYTVAEDKSKFSGTWDKGTFVSGKWEFADGGYYEGSFRNGQPSGEGKFVMAGGSTVAGEYAAKTEEVDGEEVTSVEWAAGAVTMVSA